ncbi:MAG: Flp pilus assembly protein CpaB [Zoogloeaceae bacterium]|nr:Flp pilus assembly protein CpaB [Rhodocyclaceae bacterium]MCP5234917.1 Flp pilus assembly protein CpaB [Zoogloeaceae bacterium]
MRSTRALMMILVSLLAGVMAIVFAARWLNEQTAMATRKVAVASVDLDLGQQITAEHFRMVDWPSGSVPDGAFSDPDQLTDRVTRINLLQNEPVLEAKLAPKGTRGGLSAVIAEGKRAITVRVNDVVGVAGFALPGNYVDVIVSTKDESKDKDKQNISKIVLEKILVLAVGEEAGRDDTKPKVVKAVTLEVTPEQAEALDLARSVGQLSLVLRNQIDTAPVATQGITKDVLLGLEQPVAAAPKPVVKVRHVVRRVVVAPPAKECVEVFNGRSRSEQCF